MAKEAEYEKVETGNVELSEVGLPEATPVNESLPVFFVTAPCDLEAGFEFAVSFEGKKYQAMVPQGGVRVGQTFSPENIQELDIGVRLPKGGKWKADVFECLDNRHCLLAWLCGLCYLPSILGTVMNRLRGQPGSHGLCVLLCVVFPVSYFLMRVPDSDPQMRALSVTCALVFQVALCILYIASCLIRTRLRRRLAIEGDECEDCLLSWFCNCCVILQMHNQVDGTTTGRPLIGKIDNALVKTSKEREDIIKVATIV